MKNNNISTFKIAATYIGTIVGAGFASGQEVLQFFSVFGIKGFLGLIITTVLFIFFGFVIMDLGKKLNSSSHLEIIRYSSGKFFGNIVDYIITFFLFGGLTAMIAGSGAMINEQFNIPAVWGNLLMAFITAITVLTGIKGVINSISFVVPFLLASVIGISILSIVNNPINLNNLETVSSSNSSLLIRHWLLAAILYTSYNTVISVAILGPLGKEAKNHTSIKYGALLGGLGLGIGSMFIYFAVLSNIQNAPNYEIPMIYIAGNISITIQFIYSIVLIAEIYTTAVGSLYGFVSRMTSKRNLNSTLVILATTIIAFFAGQLGFSNLVRYLYPIVGYGGIILLISLVITKVKVLKK
jgi:uncharacterized membrane protein YkvI